MGQQRHKDPPEAPKRAHPRMWGVGWEMGLFEAINCFESLPTKTHYTLYNQDNPDEVIASLRLDAPTSAYRGRRRSCVVEIGQIRQHDGKFVPFHYSEGAPEFEDADTMNVVSWRWSLEIPGHDMYEANLSHILLQGSAVTGVLTCDRTGQSECAIPISAIDSAVSHCLPKHVRVIIQ